MVKAEEKSELHRQVAKVRRDDDLQDRKGCRMVLIFVMKDEGQVHRPQGLPTGVDPQEETGGRGETREARSRPPQGPRESHTGEAPRATVRSADRSAAIEGPDQVATVSPGASDDFLYQWILRPCRRRGLGWKCPRWTNRIRPRERWRWSTTITEPGQPMVRWVARLTEF